MCQFPNYLGIWGVLLWGDHSWSHWAKAWVGRISVILDGQRIGSLFLEWKRSCWEGILFKSGGERELWLRMFSSPPTTDQDDDQDKKNLASFQLDLFNKSLHWVGQKKHFFDLPLCLLTRCEVMLEKPKNIFGYSSFRFYFSIVIIMLNFYMAAETDLWV